MKYILLLSLTVFVWACQSVAPTTPPDLSNQWGKYRGTTAEGDLLELRIMADKRYEWRYIPQNSTQPVQQHKGTFTWEADGKTLHLDEVKTVWNRYTFTDNTLLPLLADKAQKPLTKIDFAQEIEGKYWRVLEIKGQSVKLGPSEPQEPYFKLMPHTQKLEGHGGCNLLSGTYRIQAGQRLHLESLSLTERACFTGGAYEKALLQALSEVDNYQLYNDTLSLSKARMAPSLKCVAVYF